MFVLRRVPDGKYVSKPGSERSYTDKLEDARVFDTRPLADADRCGNEEAVEIADLLRAGSRR